MLESYLIDFSALESKIELARNQIQNAEELVSVRCLVERFLLSPSCALDPLGH